MKKKGECHKNLDSWKQNLFKWSEIILHIEMKKSNLFLPKISRLPRPKLWGLTWLQWEVKQREIVTNLQNQVKLPYYQRRLKERSGFDVEIDDVFDILF